MAFQTKVPTFIWEIGANHMGSISKTFNMLSDIERTAGPGSYVKLQWFDPNLLATPDATFANGRRQRAELFKASMPWDTMLLALNQAKDLGLNLGVTVFSAEHAQRVVNEWPVRFFKVASPDAIDRDLLRVYLKDPQRRPLFVSTGGMDFKEISGLVQFLHRNHSEDQQIIFMHCMSQYPAPSFHLPSWKYLRHKVSDYSAPNWSVGYSDHAADHQFVMLAACLGAAWIERHVYSKPDDIDVNCATPLADIGDLQRKVHHELTSTFRADTTSIHYTRRFWCLTKDCPPGHRLRLEDIKLARCTVKDVIDAHGSFSAASPEYLLIDRILIHGGKKHQPINQNMLEPLL